MPLSLAASHFEERQLFWEIAVKTETTHVASETGVCRSVVLKQMAVCASTVLGTIAFNLWGDEGTQKQCAFLCGTRFLTCKSGEQEVCS